MANEREDEDGLGGSCYLLEHWRRSARHRQDAALLETRVLDQSDGGNATKSARVDRRRATKTVRTMAAESKVQALSRSNLGRCQEVVHFVEEKCKSIRRLCFLCRGGGGGEFNEIRVNYSFMKQQKKEDRVLFHYNGHGVPRPTVNGEIWVFNKEFTQYIPLSLYEVQTWMGTPSLYVWDCSNAGLIIQSFLQFEDDRENEVGQLVI